MQVIDPTFRAFAGSLAGRGIWDPLANIFAAIKYAQAVYGPSLMAGGRGLRSGRRPGLGPARALPRRAGGGAVSPAPGHLRGRGEGWPLRRPPRPAAPYRASRPAA